jgi:hypothetical protein
MRFDVVGHRVLMIGFETAIAIKAVHQSQFNEYC